VTADSPAVRACDGGSALSVRVVPRASASEILNSEGGALRVRLTAPPVDGRANDALVVLVAAALGVSRASVAVVAGARARRKVLRIEGLAPAEVARRLGLV